MVDVDQPMDLDKALDKGKGPATQSNGKAYELPWVGPPILWSLSFAVGHAMLA